MLAPFSNSSSYYPEQLADEQRQEVVKSAADEYLIRNPDWQPSQQPSQQPAPAGQPVTSTKQKVNRIKKSLDAGAGGFQEHVIDPELLARARKAARVFQTADPDRYSDIITAASP